MRFRKIAGFGKRIEFGLLAQMLKEGLDVFVPVVDDKGIDAVVRRADGTYVEVQIKARSSDAQPGTAGLFSVRSHELKHNFWFVFFSERMDKMWIMTSQQFIDEAGQTKRGKWEGLRWIKFNGKRINKTTGDYEEPMYARFEKYVATSFDRIAAEAPVNS
jgi:hypothetical protein